MKRIAALAAVVVLAVAGWTAFWFFVAGQVRAGIELMAANDGVTAPVVRCERLDIGGYPFRFDIDCLGGTATLADLTLAIPEVRISTLVYRSSHYLASARGPAELSDAFTGAHSRIDWGTLEGSLRYTGDRIERLSVVGDALAWTDTLAGETLLARGEHVELHLIDIPEQFNAETFMAALAGYADGRGLEVPAWGIAGGTATLETQLTGLPSDIDLLFADPAPLRTWAQAGGRLQVVRLALADAATSLEADGTIGLNDSAQPEGQVHLASRGLTERIGTAVPEPFRSMVLGTVGEDGRSTQTFNIRSGVVFAGLLPVWTFQPLY